MHRVVFSIALLHAAPALAQLEETKPVTEEGPGMVVWTAVTWPTELNEQPLVMSKGMFQIHVDAYASLSDGAAFQPFALAPDIYYGVSDRFTVGLVHNVGLCLTGDTNGCPSVYNDFGFQARFLVKRTYNIELAAVGSFDAITVDPFALGMKLGAAFKYKRGRLAFLLEPTLKVGLTERDGVVDPMTMVVVGANKETLAIPLRVSYQQSLKLAFYGRTGLAGVPLTPDTSPGAQLDNFGDSFAIPLGLGVQYGWSSKLDFGAEFQLPALIWPGKPAMGPGPFDVRALFLFVDYRI